MRPPVEPSGVGTPDLGWQQSGRRGRAAAARTSITPAETLAGTQASPRHGSGTVVSTSSAQCGLPTPAQYDPYTAPNSYTEPGPPNPLQEQMAAQREQLTARGEQMNALTVQLTALTAAMMAGQRASAAEVRTPSSRPSPPWTAATLPAAPAAPPAPPAPAPPPPPTPAAPPPPTPAAQPAATPPAAPAASPAPPTPAPPPPPTPAVLPPPTPAAQPTPTPPGAAPLYELNGPDFCDTTAAERRWPAIEPLAIRS